MMRRALIALMRRHDDGRWGIRIAAVRSVRADWSEGVSMWVRVRLLQYPSHARIPA